MPISKTDPLWYKDAIIYELHVKAFKDSNGDGTGDFRGLIEKLDYIQNLGVNTIWLLPFYPSPFKDDGYDISDYRGIHPGYGTLRDFRTFIREAHRRKIRVITELVINHTSDQHHWFQAARRAKANSARRKYYIWSKTNTKFPETRIIFTDTESSNWAWDPEAKAYYWHRFFSHQPDLNHNNPKVVQAVLKVMKFWLDMGVDGLRLDAVPYLCVREGTNNENLPETHTVLKQFRGYLDKHYSSRMFLAEANQWPEDVRHYFGDGDECHMAFHFPLMPRMFMALRQEDRHPITDILERTPEIPSNCQWALFLRNHDELTLEMVSDAERDYMYREYAQDSRMKLNIGIRRRLAPLLDNSRRRIELLNSLLLSMPGSPVIYYGDELGMGDNIFLGDRDGVRTPMQWNMDRNAGFSSADAARLYHPVIMDPVYGFQAVNVEAQERNPSSMLQFMRRMIALRRQHKVFGRGSIEFLKPINRKILAYIRRYKGEVILVVANLSRFVEPAELDLSEFTERIPVEMIGRNEFPPIGDLPYFLTLGPHSFYWFRLEPQAEPIKARLKSSEAPPQVPQLTLNEMWDTLLEPEYLYALGHDILPPFLARQRWFRGKARDVTSCSLADYCKLGASFYLILLQVDYENGDQEIYVMPLKIIQGAPATSLTREIPESIVASVKNWRGSGILYDALMDRASCDILFAAIGDGRRYRTDKRGTIFMQPTNAYKEMSIPDNPCGTVRRLGVEQSNTSIIIGDAFVLKIYRKLEEGQNPDVEISHFLTEQGQFGNIASVVGTMHYTDTSGRQSALGMLQQWVPNQGDGWSLTMMALDKYYRRVLPLQEQGEKAPVSGQSFVSPSRLEPPSFFLDLVGDSLRDITTLGRRTAEFHLALSAEKKNRDFAPLKATPYFTSQYAEAIFREGEEALAILSQKITDLSDQTRKTAEQVLIKGPDLLGKVHEFAAVGENLGYLIRVHGDYHLGQVLRAENDDFILLDFEGEPMRTLSERRRKCSPFKDVAGMVRSLHYAAHAALQQTSGEAGPDADLLAWSRAWYEWMSTAFVAAYLETAEGAPFLPAADLDFIFEIFLLEKVFYELKYELGNRPDWVNLPLAGLAAISGKKK